MWLVCFCVGLYFLGCIGTSQLVSIKICGNLHNVICDVYWSYILYWVTFFLRRKRTQTLYAKMTEWRKERVTKKLTGPTVYWVMTFMCFLCVLVCCSYTLMLIINDWLKCHFYVVVLSFCFCWHIPLFHDKVNLPENPVMPSAPTCLALLFLVTCFVLALFTFMTVWTAVNAGFFQ